METTEPKPLGERLKEAAAAMREGNADAQLDPGIADVVIMLRNLGFHPTDSGDGRSKPDAERDFDVKHVACTVDVEDKLFDGARRLQQVLGLSWKVKASFDPSDGGSCILLATKNEEPGPRHADATSAFDEALMRDGGNDDMVAYERDRWRCVARQLRDALHRELGRR